jgi:pimeloyl-ACP methyl ester carboxylesterase
MSETLFQAKLATIARDASQRRTVIVNGTETVYWFYPKRNLKSKTKRSIVFIHGYRGNHHGLEAIAGAIEDFDIYIPDLPGFGQSAAFRVDHSVEHYASWLNGFIQSLNFGSTKPHLLGHSFGSIVVSGYAAKYNGIATLILENPVASPALKGPKAAMTAVAKAFFWLAGIFPENLGDAILKSWPMVRGMSIIMTKSRIKELRAWVHRQHDENFNDFANRRVALEGYTASISNCVSDFVQNFKMPVLMMIGDKDDITSVTQQQKLFTKIPSGDKHIEIFEGVGHLTHYEIPTQIGKAISDWSKAHD